MELGIGRVPELHLAQSPTEPEQCVTVLTRAIEGDIQLAVQLDGVRRRSAPWWTPQCAQARRLHLRSTDRSDNGSRTPETKAFLLLVRKAKRDYWQQVIDGAKDNSVLYKVIDCHKSGQSAGGHLYPRTGTK